MSVLEDWELEWQELQGEREELILMKWFGTRWDSVVCFETQRAETPIGQLCSYCQQAIGKHDRGFVLPTVGQADVPFHHACLVDMLGLSDYEAKSHGLPGR